MSNSASKIDYSIRPAKCVERKIICELLQKFQKETPVNQYRYIGFGSFYFTDFILFHNQLNIEKMISIEKSHKFDRYKFNKPYKCIEIKFCEAQDALSREINFSESAPDLIWLDYDGCISEGIVSDIITASQKIKDESFLFVSYNTGIKFIDDDNKLSQLTEMFEEYLPSLKEKDITSISMPQILCNTIDNAIQKSVSDNNISGEMKATSIFNVKYRDGALMCTLGYYFHCKEKVVDFEPIKTLPGVTSGKEPVDLRVPRLTKAEIRELNRLLPGSTLEEIKKELPYLEDHDIESYKKLYRFYPNYVDSPFYT